MGLFAERRTVAATIALADRLRSKRFSHQPARWMSDGALRGGGLVAPGRRHRWICQPGRPAVDGAPVTWCERIATARLSWVDAVGICYEASGVGRPSLGCTPTARWQPDRHRSAVRPMVARRPPSAAPPRISAACASPLASQSPREPAAPAGDRRSPAGAVRCTTRMPRPARTPGRSR
jgi:hypothetical protein